MKIAFFNSLYLPDEVGGAEKAVRTIAEGAVAAGHQAVVLCLASDGRARTDMVNGVKVYYIPLANVAPLHDKASLPVWRKLLWYIMDAYNPVMGHRIKRILKEEKPDVIEANNLQGLSVAVWHVARQLGIPVVQILHDYYLGCINSTMYSKGRNCTSSCAVCTVLCTPRRRLSSIPQIVSSVSRRTLERIRAAGTFAAVKTFTYSSSGIKLSDVLGATERAIHQPGAPIILGFLGRIDPLKGMDLLLDAVSSRPAGSVKLLIGGEVRDAYGLDLKARYESPNIEFLGYIKPAELFSRVHLLIVPSVWEEPLGRIIAESHASGVLVAVSKLGGMPEIVEDGVNGYHFDGGSVAAIHGLLDRLKDQTFPTAEQVAACHAVVSRYNIDDVLRHHIAMWQQAVSAKVRA